MFLSLLGAKPNATMHDHLLFLLSAPTPVFLPTPLFPPVCSNVQRTTQPYLPSWYNSSRGDDFFVMTQVRKGATHDTSLGVVCQIAMRIGPLPVFVVRKSPPLSYFALAHSNSTLFRRRRDSTSKTLLTVRQIAAQ